MEEMILAPYALNISITKKNPLFVADTNVVIVYIQNAGINTTR
jgi:hypothetical protein